MPKRPDQDPILVMKFGGTSVGSVEAFSQVIGIVTETAQTWKRLVVVVSALSGVTNLLLESAGQAARGDRGTFARAAGELQARHSALAEAFLPPGSRLEEVKAQVGQLVGEFTNLCQAIVVLGETTPRALDAIAGLGERMCVRVLRAALQEAGLRAEAVDATELIVTDTRFQSAEPDFEASSQKTRQRLEPLLAAGAIPVVTGFIGATPDGSTTTLGRGGSDYSAAILGTVLPARQVWIWTDVDGVMTADPRLIPEAHTIPELTFREVAELAYFGAKVLHPKTVRPIVDQGIALRVCNTFAPEKPGTWVVRQRQGRDTGVTPFPLKTSSGNGVTPFPVKSSGGNGVVQAITGIRGLELITVEGRGMMGVVGVAARTFHAVAETGTSVPLISQASSEQSICFAVPQEASARVRAALEQEFALEIARRDIDSVWATPEIGILTVVGEGMRNTPGVAGRVFSALGAEGVNVIAIAQGSSEVSISLVLDAGEFEAGMRALHRLIG